MTTAVPKFTTITPTQAMKMLEAHQVVVDASGLSALNRIINDNTVVQYGTDMKDHKWIENGETIKVAKTGRILDGQHRLWGCVQSQASFKTLLITGFSDSEAEDVFVTTDIGGKKIPSAFLSASGVGYGGYVAPAVRYIMCYRQHHSLTKMHMVTTPDVVAFGKAHADHLVDSAAFISKHQGYAPGSTLCAWHYLMSEKNQEEAAKFIVDLKDGVGLSKGDPIHAMRERLIQHKGKGKAKLSPKSVFALGLNIWNDRRKNITRTVIKAPHMNYSELPKLV